MFDIACINKCDHLIIDEALELSGTSPTFVTTLSVKSNGNKNTTFIRDINFVADNPTLARKLAGITNYDFSSDGQFIEFGTSPVDSGMNFPNPDTSIVPVNTYWIDYVADPDNCPKCGGTGLVKDVIYGTTGDLVITVTAKKIVQRVIKALLTTIGKNITDPLYGSDLPSLIGQEIDLFTAVRIQKAVQDTVTHLIDLQTQEDLSDEETIQGISSMNVYADDTDPSLYYLSIEVIDGKGNKIPVTFSLNK